MKVQDMAQNLYSDTRGQSERPVTFTKSLNSHLYPEYRRTRETRWEYGGTILQA